MASWSCLCSAVLTHGSGGGCLSTALHRHDQLAKYASSLLLLRVLTTRFTTVHDKVHDWYKNPTGKPRMGLEV